MNFLNIFKKKQTKSHSFRKSATGAGEAEPLIPAAEMSSEAAPASAAKPFTVPVPDLEKLYECSVQKTAADFVSADTGRAFTFDSADSSDTSSLLRAYDPNILGQEIIFTYYAKQGFIGFNNCALLAQDWLILKAISAPCEDAVSVNYDITIKDREITDEDKSVIDEMKLISNDNTKFDIKTICRKFAENKRKYGQALCIPRVEGANLENPFNIDSIAPDSYKGMTVIEPAWAAPVLDTESITNPASPRFYQPTWFKLPNGQLIHHSWFIFNIYGSVSDILKPSYYFGGVPLPQLLYEQVYAAHKTAKEAPMLAQSKRLNYMEGNLNAYVMDEEKLHKDVNMLSYLRNNWGWLFLKKDQSIGQLDTNLSDFDAVTMLGYQIVAAISGVIAPRLLETSPKGWQSSGSYEADSYRRVQQSIQRIDFAPILNFHYRLLGKSKYDVDNMYDVVFDPIDTPTELELAQTREINSRTDMNYIQAGVVSPDEVRDILREDETSGYNVLADDIEGEPFEGAIQGGSATAQSPFNLDEWEESDHPRDDGGKFTSGGSRGKINKRERKALKLPKKEYSKVMHELNTNLSKKQRKQRTITKAIGDYRYTVINKGFNNYIIIGKQDIDKMFN